MNNNVLLIGRLTRDIEVRYTESNIAVGNITLAVPSSFKNKNGEYDTDFINCVLYKEIAERVKEYTHKGDLIAVRGRLHTRTYDDKEGIKHFITEVIVERITFLSPKKETTQEVAEEHKEETQIESDPFEEFNEQVQLSDEDLPF